MKAAAGGGTEDIPHRRVNHGRAGVNVFAVFGWPSLRFLNGEIELTSLGSDPWARESW